MSESRLYLPDCMGTGVVDGLRDDPFRQPIEVAGAKVGLVDWRPDPTKPEGSFIVMVTAPASVHAKIAEPFLPLFANADGTGYLGLDDTLSLVHKSFWPEIVDMLEERGAPIDEVVAAKASWRYRDLAALACRHALHRQFKQGQGVVLPWAEESPTRLKALLGRDLKDLPAGRLGDLRDWLREKSFEVTREFVLSATVRELLNRMGRDLIAPELTGRRDGRWRIFLGDRVPLWVSQASTRRRRASKSYSESFNTADSDTLGPDQTWVEIYGYCKIVSNKARAGYQKVGPWTGQGEAYASSAQLDTTDHYVETDLSHQYANDDDCGPFARKENNGTRTFYLFGTGWNTGSPRRHIYKFVNGSRTVVVEGGTGVATAVHRIECNGTTIKAYINDVEVLSVTDASITTGQYGGFRGAGYETNRWTDFDWINFQDLGFGETVIPDYHTTSRGLRRGIARGIG